MTMKLKDGWTGTAYTLPETMTLKGLPDVTMQSAMKDFAYGQGRYPLGDWIVRSKTLRLEGWVIGNTPTHVKTLHEEFRNAFLIEPDNDYYCLWYFPWDDDWSWRVFTKKLSGTYEKGGFNRVIKVRADLEMLFDALEYKELTASGPTNIDADPKDLTVSPEVAVETPAVITITAATTLADGFVIEQKVGGNVRKTMSYAGSLINTDVVEIDAVAGTVKLNGSNDINNFEGQFPTAMPYDISGSARTHTFTITGTGYAGTWATFKYEYRKNRVGSLSD